MSVFSKINISSMAELDEAAKALAAAWGQSFEPAPNFHGKKKNKLRDVACRLNGYEDGLQQFLGHLEALKIPTTEQHFDLPDELVIKTRPWGIEDELIVGRYKDNNSYLHRSNEHCLHVLLDEQGGDPNATDYVDLISQYGGLKNLPLWQFICQHYCAKSVTIEMANIEKYGVGDYATEQGGFDMVRDLYITPASGFMVIPVNRCDDGSDQAFIRLVRNR